MRILLINPFGGTGHHESWTALCVTLLLRHGHQVVCLTPCPQTIRDYLERSQESLAGSVEILECRVSPLSISSPPSAEPVASSNVASDSTAPLAPSSEEEGNGILKIYYRYICPLLDTTTDSVSPAYCQKAKDMLRWTLRTAYYAASWLGSFCLFPRLLVQIRRICTFFRNTGVIRPDEFAQAIEQSLAHAGRRPDFMFVMYMDAFAGRFLARDWRRAAISIPWGGISFLSNSTSPGRAPHERYFRQRRFRGLCFLQYDDVRRYQAAFPSKVFEVLPDVANAELPTVTTPLARSIAERAAGRTVVALVGSLEGRKNISLFCKVALLADADRWFFLMAGELHRSSFSREDEEAFVALMNLRDNFCLHDQFFDDERELNEVLAASDILFAVYRNFPKSSNMLGKAAHFRKPLLVSDRFIMGERVRRYGLGEAVPEDSPEASLAALDRLQREPLNDVCFDDYLRTHNAEVMGRALERFAARCIEGAAL